MRAFLNGILSFIGAESMTDEEFATISSTLLLYDQSTYDDLSDILESREAVSSLQDKLLAYYHARGAEITAATTGKSNIFIGCPL